MTNISFSDCKLSANRLCMVNNVKYTVFQKKLVHEAHIDNLVNSQRIFKILSLTHSIENLL